MTAGGATDAGSTARVGLALEKAADCVSVFAGVNDYRLGKPLGRLGDSDIFTFRRLRTG